MSNTLTCPSDLGILPDSSEKSHNDEHLIVISPTFGSISPSLPEGRSSVQVFSPSSPSNLTSNVSNTSAELSFSASSIGSMQQNISSDIEDIFNLRTKNPNNPIIGFLNINSLRNKITDLKMVMERCLPDILLVEETKLNSDFKTETFLMNDYQRPIRRDKNESGGGLMQFIRKGVVCNRVSTFECPTIELICSELMVCKKRWAIFSIYRPPDAANMEVFFRELSSSLNSALDKYDDVMIMGDINIGTHDIHHPGKSPIALFRSQTAVSAFCVQSRHVCLQEDWGL